MFSKIIVGAVGAALLFGSISSATAKDRDHTQAVPKAHAHLSKHARNARARAFAPSGVSGNAYYPDVAVGDMNW